MKSYIAMEGCFRPIADILDHGQETNLARDAGDRTVRRLLLTLTTCLLSCAPPSHVPTDNVIRETAPFQQFRERYNNGTRTILIERARRFGEQNGFEVAVNEFGAEGFSILLTRPDLNLVAVHSAFHAGPLEIGGIVSGAATVAQRQTLARFRAYLTSSTADHG